MNSNEEVIAWTKKFIKKLRKKYVIKGRKKLCSSRDCFQLLVNIYYSTEGLDLKNADFYNTFPYFNDNQKKEFRRIQPTVSSSVKITTSDKQ